MVYIMGNEEKCTNEKIRAIVDDVICKAKSAGNIELSPDELEQVAGGRTLTTGEVLTEKVIDEYVAIFIKNGITADELIILNNALGFYPTVPTDLVEANKAKYGENAWIHYWAMKQKAKVQQELDGDYTGWEQYSTG